MTVPESEETRPTDAEVAKVGQAALHAWLEHGIEDDAWTHVGRAALKAAAALRQPREGGERSEKAKVAAVTAKAIQKAQAHTQDEWASLRRELDSVAEERDRALARKDEWHKRFDVLAEENQALRTRISLAIGRIERGEPGAALTGLQAALVNAEMGDEIERPEPQCVCGLPRHHQGGCRVLGFN